MNIKTTKHKCRLYLITPPDFILSEFRQKLALALDSGDIACVQLRLKNASERRIMKTIESLRPIVQERNVSFILNDDPKLAYQGGCNGVHIGQKDAVYEDARDILGASATIGVTCKNDPQLAILASENGADYVAFGAFFPTKTKITYNRASPEIINIWSQTMNIPSVAIGGITPKNCAPLVRAGANFLAVISSVWEHAGGPGAAIKEFNRVISNNS